MADSKRRRTRPVTRSISKARYAIAVDLIVKDIMEEHILGKLPLKDLMRFKSVCKSWNNSIPKIAKSVLGPRKMVRSTRCFRGIHILDLEANSGVQQQLCLALNAQGKLVGSSNGLLCINFERKVTVLWNPLIKEQRYVQVSVREPNSHQEQLIGFGYDASSDDFKIVRFFPDSSPDEENALLLVYSLKTNSWTNLNIERSVSESFCVHGFCARGTLANGSLYWPVRKKNTNKCRILRYNLTDDKLSFMETPFHNDGDDAADVTNRRLNFGLMVSEGKELCAYMHGTYDVYMWVLVEEGQETEPAKWTHLLDIQRFASIPSRQVTMTPTVRYIAPLSFMTNGKVLVSRILWGEWTNELGLYNPGNNNLKEYYADEVYLDGNGRPYATDRAYEYTKNEEDYGNLTYEASIQPLLS